MKKIGILTYHRAYSYGAKLQAYALTTYLRKIGFDAEDIDYGCIGEEKLRRIHSASLKDLIVTTLCYICSWYSEPRRIKRFKEFLDIMPKSSKRYLTKESLKSANDEYDYFICGSDQVWCPRYNEDDTSFLLDFVTDNTKKFSYAASFGVCELDRKHSEKYAELLKSFNTLLLREKSGQELIKSLTGRESQIVLDPTFLLDNEDWNKIARYPYKKKFPYILSFRIIAFDTDYDEYVDYLHKLTGYKVIELTEAYRYKPLKHTGYYQAGPAEFLGLIREAAIVVTNSFHATVFSIFYNRPFYTLLNKFGLNTRMIELTNKFGLGSRLFDGNTPKPTLNNIVIDYTEANKLISKHIAHTKHIIDVTFKK